MARETWTAAQRPQSEARRRQRQTRLVMLLGALVLVGGVIAIVQVVTDEGPPPTKATPAQIKASASANARPTVRRGGSLAPDAKRVVQRFVITTLGRTDLEEAWGLATPAITSAVTKEQWLNGELPIPPFPVDKLITTGYDVIASSPKKVMVQILLVPKAETGLGAIRYDMTIERKAATPGSPWKVSYFLPYAPPGIRAPG